MTEHLPECWAKHDSDPPAWCICDELRTCEQRVKRVERPLSFLKGATYGRDCGWDEALDAAEAAVLAVDPASEEYDDWYPKGERLALAAIRALKEKP